MDTIRIIESANCPEGRAYIVDTHHAALLVNNSLPYTVRSVAELPEVVRKVIEDMIRAGCKPSTLSYSLPTAGRRMTTWSARTVPRPERSCTSAAECASTGSPSLHAPSASQSVATADDNAMTRWKREYRLWARREGLTVFMVPKSPKDWDVAKAMSQLIAHMAPEIEERVEAALINQLLYG